MCKRVNSNAKDSMLLEQRGCGRGRGRGRGCGCGCGCGCEGSEERRGMNRAIRW
jgi:hypothetical protein